MNAHAVRTGELLPPQPIAEPRRVKLRLWLPLTPLFFLLSPFALLFAPFAWIAIPKGQRPPNPYTAAIALGGVLLALGGLKVDIDTRHARVLIVIL
jgi:hypothetical protein